MGHDAPLEAFFCFRVESKRGEETGGTTGNRVKREKKKIYIYMYTVRLLL